MDDALEVMRQFPGEFVPLHTAPPPAEWRESATPTLEAALSNPAIASWLRSMLDSMPHRLPGVFVEVSGVLGQILGMFGVTSELKMEDVVAAGISDPSTLELITAYGQLEQDAKEADSDSLSAKGADPLGMREAMLNELRRRSIARRAPFARTLTTLLGPDALLCLTADGSEGFGRMQPHEFSRVGWPTIWSIENQLAIEQELLSLPPDAEHLAKIVVALSWTLVALAGFIPPAVFLGESMPHISSERAGRYTISSGTGTHTLVAFHTSAMVALVRILAEALRSSMLNAADLMWIGAGVVRMRDVQSGHAPALLPKQDCFGLFLSHRGRDSKRTLSEAVQTLPPTHGIYLDCLTLPRGEVNRSFIFGSLARSEQVLLVDTENYDESTWCRKEAWFAEALAANGLATIRRLKLAEAQAHVVAKGAETVRKRIPQVLPYLIAPRVLSDLDYWARTPNLHSLKESGHGTGSLAPLQSLLAQAGHAEDPVWVQSLGSAVMATLSAIVAEVPDAKVFDLWASALQLSLAAFASTSAARSKVEVRRGVDQLNAALRSVLGARLHVDPVFRDQPASYLALLASASAIQLCEYKLDPRMIPAVRLALGGAAVLYDGVILLDVRDPGPERDFRLRLAAKLAKSNLGTVGLIQDALDSVHQRRIDDLPLEMLPCVTLYPGMAAPVACAVNCVKQ